MVALKLIEFHLQIGFSVEISRVWMSVKIESLLRLICIFQLDWTSQQSAYILGIFELTPENKSSKRREERGGNFR